MKKMLVITVALTAISGPGCAAAPSEDTLHLAAGMTVYGIKCEKAKLSPPMPTYLHDNLKLLMTADGVTWDEQFSAKVDVFINFNPLLRSIATENDPDHLRTVCNVLYEGLGSLGKQ